MISITADNKSTLTEAGHKGEHCKLNSDNIIHSCNVLRRYYEINL